MRFYIPLLFLLFPLMVLAQTGSITGKVIRMDNKSPMAKASVFLSNSSYGTITNDDGTFTLSGLKPGQYELVVTSVGFEDFNKTIMVPRDAKEPVRVDVEMIVKTTQLHEVVITTPENWKRNYEQFVKLFLGESANAKKCKILNPHSLSFLNHKAKQSLEAWSDEFIEIENKALGYKVKFLLKEFNYNGIDNIISWEGKILFNELPGSVSQKKQWEEKRNDIYYGSNMHFFRSLQNAKLSEDGFAVMILERKPNPNRPQQEMLMKKINFWGQNNIDSANKYRRLYNLPKYDENLIRQPLKETDIARATEQPGVFVIGFPEHLYVMYTKKREEEYMADIYRPLDMPNYQVSIITLHTQYSMFDMNGSIISTPPPLFEGTWSKNKVAELLPVDYVPGELVLKEKL
ncbi:carboxypeptidase-like regulatory domain-containing protein [Mucilaginibacter mali]|uniref:Carboxypeptidase-like regulatory domain-containing protein n=1 Tax=Mucilaginibacter mali TaxID=2740462 RepID=A0A7D4QJ75_9SPHI|nr:carboxypeptidase-like regulatory domain-containing protein [Mucilaginibacter mali]QKJ29590.1 carboxypeptidase-like regulatory domain-containing protein [Mucilaginibacter mali]